MGYEDHDSGFVLLYRSIMSWEWYWDDKTYRLFLYLLMTANFKTRRIGGRTVKRGQLVTSIKRLSAENRLTPRQTRTALSHLELTGEVTSETSPQGTIITIKNYAKYQIATSGLSNDRQTTSDKQTAKRATSDRQTTDKPSLLKKKEKKREGENPPPADTLSQKFVPPSAEQVAAYCGEKGYHVDPEQFVFFYESKGWMVGKSKMKNWKAAVATWEKRDKAAGKIPEEQDEYK